MDLEYYKKYEPIFSAYYIKKFLGEGSFGKVFLIERDSFGMKYEAALKVITVPHSKSDLENKLSYMTEANARSYYEDIVNSIVSEFHLMSKLKGHSHIVSYEDHADIPHEGVIGWDILIRMEVLTPLQKYTDLQKFPVEDAVKLGIDMCKALEKCQLEGIIHRDIKPENIFVSADGNYKLGDFGVARTIEKTTGEFTRIGTPPYMAPEIHRGSQYASSVDIYSLGLVMYRLLNKNRMPFLPSFPEKIEPGDEDLAISKRIMGTEMPPPVNADKQLAAIILKACAHDPEDRYKKPAEMREELESLQHRNKPDLRKIQKTADENETEQTSDDTTMPDKLMPEAPIANEQGQVRGSNLKSKLTSPGTEVLIHHETASNRSSEAANQGSASPVRKAKIGHIFCVNCGAEIRRDSLSCISCRKQLRKI